MAGEKGKEAPSYHLTMWWMSPKMFRKSDNIHLSELIYCGCYVATPRVKKGLGANSRRRAVATGEKKLKNVRGRQVFMTAVFTALRCCCQALAAH